MRRRNPTTTDIQHQGFSMVTSCVTLTHIIRKNEDVEFMYKNVIPYSRSNTELLLPALLNAF